jgi:hypothetical protein
MVSRERLGRQQLNLLCGGFGARRAPALHGQIWHPNLPGEIQLTVALKPLSGGTELNIVQEGLPDAIPVEACYLGWQDSLRNLASPVEPEINQ